MPPPPPAVRFVSSLMHAVLKLFRLRRKYTTLSVVSAYVGCRCRCRSASGCTGGVGAPWQNLWEGPSLSSRVQNKAIKFSFIVFLYLCIAFFRCGHHLVNKDLYRKILATNYILTIDEVGSSGACTGMWAPGLATHNFHTLKCSVL